MADKFLTLLDITKRNGGDAAVGMVEEVNTVAPELNSFKGRPISGITYKVKKRIALPAGPAFRNANEGSDIISSTYDQILGQCFFLDGQMQVDEAVITSGKAEGNSEAEILADEAVGVMQQKLIKLGDEFYRGTAADSKGFVGLKDLYDTSTCEVDATGTPGAASSVYLVWNTPQGVHWVFGNGGGLQMGQWQRQQVKDANNKAFMARVNNLAGWIGLGFNHTKSVVRIKNLTTASGKGLTDALVAQALAKMPIFMRNDKTNLRLCANSVTALQLQTSRSVVSGGLLNGAGSAVGGVFAPQPTESNGVEIILTDSIPNNE